MLRRDPNSRPSASAALRHEWTSGPPAASHSHPGYSHLGHSHPGHSHPLATPRSHSHAPSYAAAAAAAAIPSSHSFAPPDAPPLASDNPAPSHDTPDASPRADGSWLPAVGSLATDSAPSLELEPSDSYPRDTPLAVPPGIDAHSATAAANVHPGPATAATATAATAHPVTADLDLTGTPAPPPASLPLGSVTGAPLSPRPPPPFRANPRAHSYTGGGGAPWQLPPTWAQQLARPYRPWPPPPGMPPSWPPQQPSPMFPHIPARRDMLAGTPYPGAVPGGAGPAGVPGGGDANPGRHWAMVRSTKSLFDVVEALGGYTALRRRDSIAIPAYGTGGSSPRRDVPTSYSLPTAAKAPSTAHNRMSTCPRRPPPAAAQNPPRATARAQSSGAEGEPH
eukprot:scaffold2564_cov88-Isochrysis_galbana.AAC.1